MGGTIFSERLGGHIRRLSSTDLAQNLSWNITLTSAVEIVRVLGIAVFTDTVARLIIATLSMRDPASEREVPIFTWDNNEGSVIARMQDDGGAVGEFDLLTPVNQGAVAPTMLLGTNQDPRMNEIVFRGTTAGFGAGTVEAVALVHVIFPELGGLSSRGLPVPSW